MMQQTCLYRICVSKVSIDDGSVFTSTYLYSITNSIALSTRYILQSYSVRFLCIYSFFNVYIPFVRPLNGSSRWQTQHSRFRELDVEDYNTRTRASSVFSRCHTVYFFTSKSIFLVKSLLMVIGFSQLKGVSISKFCRTLGIWRILKPNVFARAEQVFSSQNCTVDSLFTKR